MKRMSRWLLAAAARCSCAGTSAARFSTARRAGEDHRRRRAQGHRRRQGRCATARPTSWSSVIETKIVPHFDLNRMTRLAVGKSWREATPEQQQDAGERVPDAAGALLRGGLHRVQAGEGRREAAQARRQRGRRHGARRRSCCRAARRRSGVDYAMGETPNGWKVYDVVVDGVSLVTTYRNDFTAQIQGRHRRSHQEPAGTQRESPRAGEEMIRREADRLVLEGAGHARQRAGAAGAGTGADRSRRGAHRSRRRDGRRFVGGGLLLEWMRAARRAGRRVVYLNLGNSLESLVALYGVTDLLPQDR